MTKVRWVAEGLRLGCRELKTEQLKFTHVPFFFLMLLFTSFCFLLPSQNNLLLGRVHAHEINVCDVAAAEIIAFPPAGTPARYWFWGQCWPVPRRSTPKRILVSVPPVFFPTMSRLHQELFLKRSQLKRRAYFQKKSLIPNQVKIIDSIELRYLPGPSTLLQNFDQIIKDVLSPNRPRTLYDAVVVPAMLGKHCVLYYRYVDNSFW